MTKELECYMKKISTRTTFSFHDKGMEDENSDNLRWRFEESL